MKLLIVLLLSCTSAFGVQKIFSDRKTFPFQGSGYKIQGVPRNVVYLTIDDGPTTKGTPAMLNALNKYGIKATFFVQGSFAKARPRLMREIYQSGHLIGNHAYRHTTDFPTPEVFHRSLLSTHNIISPYIGRGNYLLFRAPGGIWNRWRSSHGNSHPTLRKYIGPFFWNVGGGSPGRQDDADWKCWKRGNGVTVKMCADSYYRQIIRNYNRGQASLVLLHDLNALSGRMLDRVLGKMKRDGIDWEFRLADEMPIVEEMAWYNN